LGLPASENDLAAFVWEFGKTAGTVSRILDRFVSLALPWFLASRWSPLRLDQLLLV
jgi:hypothetical protein